MNLFIFSRLIKGHRLERDVETGVLTTRHHRRAQIHLGSGDNLSQSNVTPISSTAQTPTQTPGEMV